MSDLSAQNLFEKRAHLWRKHGFKLLSIGLSLIALVISMIIHNRADQSLTTAKAMLQQQQAMNSDADQSATMLNQYLPSYRALQERKIIAPPQRLQWLETLQTTVSENLIPKMNFVLSPTAPASSSTTIYTHDTIGIKVTPMRIEFTLMHEGDLLRLMNDMHTQSKGLFSAQNCELARNEEQIAASESAPSFSRDTFKGACDFLWYSLADVTSTWEVPNEEQ